MYAPQLRPHTKDLAVRTDPMSNKGLVHMHKLVVEAKQLGPLRISDGYNSNHQYTAQMESNQVTDIDARANSWPCP
jgi:hypothetical protein